MALLVYAEHESRSDRQFVIGMKRVDQFMGRFMREEPDLPSDLRIHIVFILREAFLQGVRIGTAISRAVEAVMNSK